MTTLDRHLEDDYASRETDDDTPELCDCGHHPLDCKCDPDPDERD